MSERRSNIRGARAFSPPPACCRRPEAGLATSAFGYLELVAQRWATKLSGNMPDIAGIMPALPDSSVCNA